MGLSFVLTYLGVSALIKMLSTISMKLSFEITLERRSLHRNVIKSQRKLIISMRDNLWLTLPIACLKNCNCDHMKVG